MDKNQELLVSQLASLMNKGNLVERVSNLEHKLNAIQFYFEHMQIGDDQMLITDENLNVLINVLNKFNCK